ncbi:unnamed protein product [Caretta caretta]
MNIKPNQPQWPENQDIPTKIGPKKRNSLEKEEFVKNVSQNGEKYREPTRKGLSVIDRGAQKNSFGSVDKMPAPSSSSSIDKVLELTRPTCGIPKTDKKEEKRIWDDIFSEILQASAASDSEQRAWKVNLADGLEKERTNRRKSQQPKEMVLHQDIMWLLWGSCFYEL